MDKEEKARKVLDEGGVFYLGMTANGNHRFIVKSLTKKQPYEVFRDARKIKYMCPCQAATWKTDGCYHMLAAETYYASNELKS